MEIGHSSWTLRTIAKVATGSVAERIAPNNKKSIKLNCILGIKLASPNMTRAMKRAESIVPITANANISAMFANKLAYMKVVRIRLRLGKVSGGGGAHPVHGIATLQNNDGQQDEKKGVRAKVC